MLARDTIFALASGALPAGVAIIRVSGPSAHRAGLALAGSLGSRGVAVLRTLRDPADGAILDSGLVLAFHAPASFTGEDTIEFQIHGSRATVAAVLRVLSGMEGCRPAEAGEFSRRAFENGRLDLTEIEGLSDLVAAETEQQRKLAISQNGGALRQLYTGWRTTLLHMRASIEADLDFSDEDDIPGSVADDIDRQITALTLQLGAHLITAKTGEIIRDGLHVVLVGAPNAGKSTLLNNLAQRPAAIVTPIPGTTRDTIEITLDIDGYRILVTDTAGLRETTDPVEIEGIRRTRKSIVKADFVVLVQDTRTDTLIDTPSDLTLNSFGDHDGVEGIDMRTEAARAAVIDAVRSHLAGLSVGEAPLATRTRHTAGAMRAMECLQSALNTSDIEIKAEHLRRATTALEELTGHISADDVLGSIFTQFCIGK